MSSNRYFELDLLRTLAVICMIAYHTAYDLEIFYGWDIGLWSAGWVMLQRGTAGLFLALVGVSFAISWDRHRARSTARYPSKYIRRGLGVLGCAVAVTIVTYIIDPETYVRFGILHLIGMTILLLPILAPLRLWNAVLGVAVIALTYVPVQIFPPFRSVDYFPLVPWLGIALIGYALGDVLYVRGKRFRERYRIGPRSRRMEWVLWPGRHALLIYLLHQPLLLGALIVMFGLPN